MQRVEIRVVPRARHNRVVPMEGGLKVYVTAPAEDGRANQAVIELLAGHFGVKKSGVRILRNERGRRKLVEIACLCFAFFLFYPGTGQAAIRTEAVPYTHGDVELEGYLAYDDALQGKRPGVLVVHEWKGLNEYAKRRARELAELGYIAFAVDMYGKGVYAQTHEEAAQLSGVFRQERNLMRARAAAGLDVLKGHPLTDSSRLGAIGYCFGGMAVLELARAGEDLKGVVSFHGGLSTPHPEDAQNIKGKVLVLTGADDPHISAEERRTFEEEMQKGDVDYRLIIFPGAVHSFTVPEAGDDPAKGVAYHADADQKSWQEMRVFFEFVFYEPKERTGQSVAN
ncbi:MAG: DUF167 domain-containing protein [Candidatus Omnitrophica bacterium]|nr:DUF167 domain-containing protein [Candidatus Omnitrophota bacterium]